MNRYTRLFLAAVFAISFTWMNAQIAESVSTVQLDRAYTCQITGASCTGSFGNYHVIR